jgi:hypothetical protein
MEAHRYGALITKLGRVPESTCFRLLLTFPSFVSLRGSTYVAIVGVLREDIFKSRNNAGKIK